MAKNGGDILSPDYFKTAEEVCHTSFHLVKTKEYLRHNEYLELLANVHESVKSALATEAPVFESRHERSISGRESRIY